jgi:hypothetical protein
MSEKSGKKVVRSLGGAGSTTQSKGRGAGGPPPNVKYGGQAAVAYVPPARREAAKEARPKSEEQPAAQTTRRPVASKPDPTPVVEAPPVAGNIFESTITLTLNKLLSSDEWPMYVSQERVPNTADRRVVNGVYIHKSWLPTPAPAKLKLRFEKA